MIKLCSNLQKKTQSNIQKSLRYLLIYENIKKYFLNYYRTVIKTITIIINIIKSHVFRTFPVLSHPNTHDNFSKYMFLNLYRKCLLLFFTNKQSSI